MGCGSLTTIFPFRPLSRLADAVFHDSLLENMR